MGLLQDFKSLHGNTSKYVIKDELEEKVAEILQLFLSNRSDLDTDPTGSRTKTL
jgi:hypothetical protein